MRRRVPVEAVLESCYPLAGHGFTREVKRRAVRRVMIDGWSCHRAGLEVGAKCETVAHWVSQTEIRMQHAERVSVPRESGR